MSTCKVGKKDKETCRDGSHNLGQKFVRKIPYKILWPLPWWKSFRNTVDTWHVNSIHIFLVPHKLKTSQIYKILKKLLLNDFIPKNDGKLF